MDALNNTIILIVDDEPDNLQEVEKVFSRSNTSCKIIKSPNGKIAFNVARKKIPDLVITDWDMPEMDGIEFIRQLQKDPLTENVPVIMFTGVMTSSENLKTALDAGAVDYIRKPLDHIELLARARTVLLLSNALKLTREQKDDLVEKNEELTKKQAELQEALDNIKTLKGLIPICGQCKKIRDDEGYWNQVESYIENHTEAQITHGLCGDCSDKLYGDQDWYKKQNSENRK